MRIYLTILLVAVVLPGCITPKAQENPKTTSQLRTVLDDFDMKMRYGLWEQAAAYATPDFRNEFLGRYEELGDDFKITELNIKEVTVGDPVTIVDIEQRSYTEPDMVVHKKRYIESWVLVNKLWKIKGRIPKEEWRKRQEGKLDAASNATAKPPPAASSTTR